MSTGIQERGMATGRQSLPSSFDWTNVNVLQGLKMIGRLIAIGIPVKERQRPPRPLKKGHRHPKHMKKRLLKVALLPCKTNRKSRPNARFVW